MLFYILEKILGECPYRILNYNDQTAQVDHLIDYSADMRFCPENVLFFCNYSSLRSDPRPSRPGDCLLLYMDETNPNPLCWSTFTNVIAVDDINSFSAILLLINSSLAQEKRLVQANHRLLQQLLQNRPLQEIINSISETYEHYADILDNAFNILITSTIIPAPDVKLAEAHMGNAIGPNVITYLRSAGSLDKMRTSRFPVYVEDEPRNTYVYSAPIFLGDALNVGFLTLFVSKGELLSPVTLYYLRETAQLMGLMMQKSTINMTNKTTYFTHLLSGMLQNQSNIAASYKERFAVFNYDLRRYKRVCVLPIQSNLPLAADVDALASATQKVLPNSVYVVFDNQIVFLSSENSVSDLSANDSLQDFLRHGMLHLGVSAFFEDENSVREHYESAKIALRLGMQRDPAKCLYLYHDYRIADIIEIISTQRNLNLLCFQPLIELLKADVESPDQNHILVKTMFCFLNNSLSVQKTCEDLFIHRNTLYYRLQKIKEIMQCDFTEFSNAVDIGITLQILRHLNIFNVFEKDEP